VRARAGPDWGNGALEKSLLKTELMFTIRCTRKLLKHLHADGLGSAARPTTILGDWYANLLFTRHVRLVICVSERSLLPIFVEAKERSTFAERFRGAAASVMECVGAPRSFIETELREMQQVGLGATSNRRVLGSLIELCFLSRDLINERPGLELAQVAAEIAETPCSLIKYESPRSMTMARLRNRSIDH
jgi:hypothetical protein